MTNANANTITDQVKQIGLAKAQRMPLGTYSRLKLDGEISDFVVSPCSSGVYFFYETGTIGKDISDKMIGFEQFNQ